nr:helix-turn-helix transcriptional regulator [Patulibacter sp. SYSU D01012]
MLRVDELTPRELEVLRCLAAGMRNPQIADALVISERTVKTHVGNVLAKLQVEDRTQAAVAALGAGIAGHEGGDRATD